ncbi:MAG: serine O-acetyltransferase [Phycisphaerae bacterium]
MNEWLNSDLETLTERILASYDSDKNTQRIGETFLPSRERIVNIVHEIWQLLFPGFYGHKKLTRQNIKFHVGALLARLGEDLTEEINHCLCQEMACTECRTPEECRAKAGRVTRDFMARIPEVRGMLSLDAQAAYDGDPAAKSIAEVIYCYPGFFAVTVYRVAHELLVLGVPLMPRIMTEHAHSVTGCDIHPGATIGKAFFIDHASGVVIGETTRIGDNVKIYQGVTLGAKSFPKDERGRIIKGLQRHPTIEDNVTIYAGSTILGGETIIGRGATVAGNTFVTSSVQADTSVRQETPKMEVRAKKRK